MKHIALCVLSLFVSLSAFANPLPEHMTGVGMFTWKETLDVDDAEFAQDTKDHGLSFVIVKTHDGSTWGTKVGDEYKPTISRNFIKEQHDRGIRVYTYFTGHPGSEKSEVDESIKNAEVTLEWGCDGIVVDDLGMYGNDRNDWEYLFSNLRKKVDEHPGTILAFSTFPHILQHREMPWSIAVTYSDYFLPQVYWKQFADMSPENAIVYAQANFDALRAYNPEMKCRLVPVGMTFENVTAEDIRTFLETTHGHYPGVALFRWGIMPEHGWETIEQSAKLFSSNDPLGLASLFDVFRVNKKESIPPQWHAIFSAIDSITRIVVEMNKED